ncbi:MAG: ATPase [Pseudomonas sp.]
MRDDFDVDLPNIRATDEDRVGTQSVEQHSLTQEPPLVRAVREPAPRRQRNGALWAVCLSLLIALVGLGYWSHEQQSRLQRQLVATQESFAAISEEAAGRLQDISGKVIATESTLTQGEQARVQQLSQLEKAVAELTESHKAQQQALQQQQLVQAGHQGLQQLQQANEADAQRFAALEQQARTLGEAQQNQQPLLAELRQQGDAIREAQEALRADMTEVSERLQVLAKLEQQLAEQGSQLARQRGEVQALLQASAGRSLEQEMLLVRSELDIRLASMEEALQAIDSFRLQTNRSLSTLQSQLNNLQQQTGQR